MDHVLARVKRLTKKPYRKVVSDHTLFEGLNVSLNACVPYNPDHNLDEDSWFKVEDLDWLQSFVHKDTLKCDLTICMEAHYEATKTL